MSLSMESLVLVLLGLSILLNLYFLFKNKIPLKKNAEMSIETNKSANILIENALLKARNDNLTARIEELNFTIRELQEQRLFLAENIEKMEKLNKEKEEVCAIAAHDIKNPAGTIKNLISLLDSYELTTGEQKQVHESLVSLSDRIIQLIENVACNVRKQGMSFLLQLSKANVNELIENVITRYKGIIKTKKIELTSEKDDNIQEFMMDKSKIEEAIENLVSNAIKFAPENSEVKVISKNQKDSVIVEVNDNGYGLSENEVKLAFNRGTTLSNKPTGNETTSGLGLWIVKKIIDEHQGKVWVKSKKGAGSSFSFRIPIKTD